LLVGDAEKKATPATCHARGEDAADHIRELAQSVRLLAQAVRILAEKVGNLEER
jgi:hypothetical protein